MAHEAIANIDILSEKSDIYSLGLVFKEIYGDKEFIYKKNNHKPQELIKEKRTDYDLYEDDLLPDEIVDLNDNIKEMFQGKLDALIYLLTTMTKPIPKERPSIEKVEKTLVEIEKTLNKLPSQNQVQSFSSSDKHLSNKTSSRVKEHNIKQENLNNNINNDELSPILFSVKTYNDIVPKSQINTAEVNIENTVQTLSL